MSTSLHEVYARALTSESVVFVCARDTDYCTLVDSKSERCDNDAISRLLTLLLVFNGMHLAGEVLLSGQVTRHPVFPRLLHPVAVYADELLVICQAPPESNRLRSMLCTKLSGYSHDVIEAGRRMCKMFASILAYCRVKRRRQASWEAKSSFSSDTHYRYGYVGSVTAAVLLYNFTPAVLRLRKPRVDFCLMAMRSVSVSRGKAALTGCLANNARWVRGFVNDEIIVSRA
ncbi:hypothetical protein Tco_1136363 [Tanacetum coccineum]